MKDRTETLVELLFLVLLFIMTLYIFTEKSAGGKIYIGITLLVSMLILAYYLGKWILIEFKILTYYINENGRRTWRLNRPTK